MSILVKANSHRAAELANSTQPQPGYRHLPLPVFLLFLGYVVFWYLQGGFRIELLGKIRFEFLMGTSLGVLALMALAHARKPARTAPRPSGLLGWIIALFIVAVMMSALSYDSATSWALLIDRVVKFAMMALFIAAFIPSPWHLRWFLVAYLLAFAKMAQEGMVGLVSGSLVWENQGTPRLHGPTPSYMHPNSFSGTQLGTIPFLISLLPLAPKWLRIGLLAQAAAAMAIVVTTGSRTGYVALILWLGWIFWHSRSKLKTLLLGCVAAAIVLPIIPTDYYERFNTIFTQQDIEGASIEARREILSDALAIIAERPLGVGVGAFTLVRAEKFDRYQHTHNLYLEVAADMGIQGLIVFLGLLFTMLRVGRRISKDMKEQLETIGQHYDSIDEASPDLRSHCKDIRLIQATAEALIGFLIIRMGLGLFGHDFYEIYWWFAAGLLIALHNMCQVAKQRTRHLVKAAAKAHKGAGIELQHHSTKNWPRKMYT